MLIFPIGHRASFVHTFPWVGLFFMVATGFGFFITYGDISDADAHVDKRGRQIAHFAYERPYLSITRTSDVEDASDWVHSRPAAPLKRHETVSASEAAEEQRRLDNMVTTYDALEQAHPYMEFGFLASEPTLKTALFSFFVHGGWLHLLGNLWMFFILGLVLEDAYGRVLFTLFIAATAAGAVLCHMTFYGALGVPIVGGSPVISGVMAAFLVRFGKTHIDCLYWVPITRVGLVMAPAWALLPIWVVLQFLQGVTVPHQAEVAAVANLAGFLIGFVLANVIHLAGLERGGRTTELAESATGAYARLLDDAREMMRRGEYGRVIHRLRKAEQVHGPGPVATTLLWRAYVKAGQAEAGTRYGVRLIQDALTDDDLVAARFAWRDLKVSVGHGGPPGLRLRLAEASASFDASFAAEVALGLPEDPRAGDLGPRAQRLLDRLPDEIVEAVLTGRETRGVILVDGALEMAASQPRPSDSGLPIHDDVAQSTGIVHPAEEEAFDPEGTDPPVLDLASAGGPPVSSSHEAPGHSLEAIAFAPTEAIVIDDPATAGSPPVESLDDSSPAPGVISPHPTGSLRLGDRWRSHHTDESEAEDDGAET